MITYDWDLVLQSRVWFGWYFGDRRKIEKGPSRYRWSYSDQWKDRLWLVPRIYGQPHPQWWTNLFNG